MSTPRTLAVTLPAPTAAMLEARVAGGTSATIEAATEGAIAEWTLRNLDDPAFVAEVRRLCGEADASGPPMDGEAALDAIEADLVAVIRSRPAA